MTASDTEILDHLSALSSAFSPKTSTFNVDLFLEYLYDNNEDTRINSRVMAYTHLSSHGCIGREPRPGEIVFPNGITSVLLLDHEDTYKLTDDGYIHDNYIVDMEEECPLLLQMNHTLISLIEQHPELEERHKFPYHTILAMVEQLSMTQSDGMRIMIKEAIKRVFLERTDSYKIVSPH